MSLLPFILDELHDLSGAGVRRHHYHGLLDDLLAPPAPRAVLRLVDLDDAPEHLHPHHHLVLRPRHLLRRQVSSPARRAHERRQQQLAAKKDDGGLLINVDVQQFLPEELSVQVLKDEGYLVVEGKHEERQDEHGYVQRAFTRRYKLPASVDPDTVTSKLTSDGVLQVTAPRREALPAAPKKNVRHVTITHTDRPAVRDATAAAAEEEEEKGKTVAAQAKQVPAKDKLVKESDEPMLVEP